MPFWIALRLASVYLRSSLHNLIVIPGKLAIASATRNLPLFVSPLAKGEIQWGFWIPVFPGMAESGTQLCKLKFQDASFRSSRN